MKVVLFCGGVGARLGDSGALPKPMVPIGPRPVLWHLMKYYSHFGHREFILCLGENGEAIKDYFLRYNECVSNDFVLTNGGKEVRLLSSDIDDWKVTFIDTGIDASIGQRLLAVRSQLEDDDAFLANYGDGLTDLPLDEYLAQFRRAGVPASFLAVHSPQSFHVAGVDDEGAVKRIQPLSASGLWVDGGFFAFRTEIFDEMSPHEDLVDDLFPRLAAQGRLLGFRYRGFWRAMDTFKDRQAFESLYEQGAAPWAVWKGDRNEARASR
jgi:glucose-1-phosphate cytidylyltransferase